MNSNDNRQNSAAQDDMEENPKQVPYRRERTPSIVVQSLGLSFQKDSAITGSIELTDDHEDDENDSSPNSSETSEPKSSTSGIEDLQQAGACDSSGGSAKGSSSSLQNSAGASPGLASPISQSKLMQRQQMFAGKPELMGATTNRRLSLNIVSNAPRRQSLTVDGLSSASFNYPSGNATGSLRNKVALKPGHSLMGWIKLASTATDLAGTGGKIMEVTPEELAKHSSERDCWVALKGNVYNVTTYLNFHPGGVDELMRGAGSDATDLFNEVHRWVNYESILAKCLVGPYKLESPLTPKGRSTFKTITEDSPAQLESRTGALATSTAPSATTTTTTAAAAASATDKPKRRDPTVAQRPNRRQSIALTVPSANKYQSLLLNNNSNTNTNQVQQPPTYVIMQDKSSIKLKVQDLTTLPLIRARHLICDLNEQMDLHVSVILSPDWLYRVHLKLDQPVDRRLTAELALEERTIVVQMNKKEQAIWNKIGTSLDLNDSLCEMTLADKFFRPSQLMSKTKLTHDTYLFEFKLNQTLMYVPISWHVLLREYQPKSNAAKQQLSNNSTSYDERIYKNYTPVLPSLCLEASDGLTDESGGFMSSLHFIVKIYQDGVVTRKLDQLQVGDMVDISDYQCVDYDVEQLVGAPKRHWVLLAAGTGITPFIRTICYLLNQNEDSVETVTLVFFNKTQDDIIWREQFDQLARGNESRFKVVNVLSNEPERLETSSKGHIWTGKRGRVSRQLLAEFVDSISPDELQMLACGPRAFTQLTKSIATELNLLEKLYIFHG